MDLQKLPISFFERLGSIEINLSTQFLYSSLHYPTAVLSLLPQMYVLHSDN